MAQVVPACRTSQSSRKVEEVTGVIDSIAFQTNILALNAAMENRPRGRKDRSFCRWRPKRASWPLRAGEAAREIKGLIATSAQNVETGTALVNGAGHTMGQIVDSIRNVASTDQRHHQHHALADPRHQRHQHRLWRAWTR